VKSIHLSTSVLVALLTTIAHTFLAACDKSPTGPTPPRSLTPVELRIEGLLGVRGQREYGRANRLPLNLSRLPRA